MENNNGNDGDQVNPLFQEHDYLQTFHEEFCISPDLIDPQIDEDLVRSLLVKERNGRFDQPRGFPETEKPWVKNYRLWMLQEVVFPSVHEYGFQRYQTAYLAVVYFEWVISLDWMIFKGMDWSIKVMAVTCMIVAAQEKGECVPYLPTLGKHMDASFDEMQPWVVRRLELKSEPKRLFITPFNFMNFLMIKFEAFPAGNGGNAASRTAAFVFTAVKVIGTTRFRPSVMAAAAILAAVDPNLTRAAIEERIRRLSSSYAYFTATAGEVHRCYSLINELDPYQELVFPARETRSSSSDGSD